MNTKNRMVVLFSMTVVMALLAACGAPQPTVTMVPTSEPPVIPTDTPPAPAGTNEGITVTFEGDQCVFHGPERVPAGRIPIVLDVRDQTAYEWYGVGAATVDEGKTMEDLIAATFDSHAPVWVHDQAFVESAQGDTQKTTLILFEGPLFLVCATSEGKTNVLGPIEIEPAASSSEVQVTTSAEALAGIWHTTTPDSFGEVYRQYTADGTYRMGRSPEELETQPLVEGEFWFEGNQLVIRDVAALPSYGSCLQPEQVGRYTVERLANGHIRFIEVEDECRDRARMLSSGEMEPVAAFPTGRFAAREGDWVLTFDDDGSFTFSSSGELSASGTFSIQGDELTWVTDSYCGPGTGKPTYTWKFENDSLQFQVKGNDACSSRRGVLDDIPYQREEWDLVVIGDSSLWGLTKAFAAQIEADVGVKVVAHDYTVGGLSAGTILEALHSEAPPSTRLEKELADDLRQAEVVVMFANPADSMDAEKLEDLASCIDARTPESPENPAESCSLEAFERYTADLAAIWAEILELRDGQPTVLRATDIYNPVVSPWKEAGAFEACTECWEAMSQAARLAAEAHDIPFLSRYDAYNGANHDQDPREKGYIRSDGEHPSELMNQHTAELLSEMGYEPLIGGPTTVSHAQNAATAVAESGDTTWDMVVLGDSLVAEDYSTLPEAYAALIQEDLGVEVEIHNLAVGGESTRSLLTNVQKYPWYREPLQEAEIVLISVGGGDLPRMENRFFRDNDCGGADNQDCLRQQLEESQAEWDALLDEILSLADPGDTLIRPIIPGILEYYARVYKDQPADVEAYNSYVVALYEHMAESCAERGVRVLDLYALYDGPNADPSLPDIADRGDGVHVGDEGDAVIAELLRDMGYEPLIIGPAAMPGAKNAATAIAESGDTTWTYVALGDSVTWGMIPLYAEMLEEDLGVTVIVHNRTVGGDHSSQLLERLRTSNWLRKELREADVITIEIPWNAFEDPCLAFLNGSPGACGGSDNQDCLREALETYKADTDAIIAEIVSLRSPSEALIRTQDTYQFNVRQSKAEGAFETINRYWREANAHVIEVAEYYHIPVARVYDAFMGEDGSEDPQDRGLIHDGFHTSPEGAALMAELFRDLGYEYAVSEPLTSPRVPTSEPAVAPTDTPSAPAEANAAITVTFEGDECIINSPERVPAGRIPIVLDVRDQTAHESYGVQTLTMDEGHTPDELVSYQQEISLPLWAHDHGFIEAAQGTSQEKTIVLVEGPLFLTCFTNTADETQPEYAGISGPIEIGPVAAFPKGRFAAEDGDWVLTFDSDGSFTFSESGVVASSGTFSIQSNELTWETDSYCDRAGKATYTWTFENGTLLFEVKGEDECASRLGVLDNIAYHREEWDLVVIGDSSMWGLVEAFAAQIEADVGVKVVSHDAAVGGLSAGTVLEWLHSESPPRTLVEKELANDLRQAEVVVMFANPADSMDAEKLQDLESCIDVSTPENPENPAESCSLEAFERYTADLAAIWAEILELRDGQPTVLRATDIYNPVVSLWKESGAFEACTKCWETMSQAARLAAEAYNIPFLSRYDAYNGLNHDQDPRENGYIDSDGEHPSELMNQHTAELLSEMGYEPLIIGPTAVPRAQNAATAVAESPDSAWDLVVLGDSLLADDYSVLPERYAAYIEEDLGVEVEIQNLAVGGETSRSLLANVQKYPWYREPLQEAEVVLISVGGGDLPGMEKRFFGGECGGADNQDCLRQQLEESQANWDALLAEIASLTNPGETLIRPIIPGILEYYARVYKDQPEDVDVYNSYVVALYERMARSCAERGIPVLDLYALYDGPNADPGLPELAGTGDGVHVSDEGDAVIAELLRELGYAPISLVTNAEALAGVWHRTTPDSSGGEVYRQYTADGTYRMGRSPEELEAQPRVEGEFWFEGDQMVMRDVTALPSYDLCLQAGQVGRYTVEQLASGHIRFVEVEDACRDRARMLGTGEMEPVR